MVDIIAKKQIEIGKGIFASRGQRVQVPEDLAKSLADRGLAEYAPDAVDLTPLRKLVGYDVTYETKDVLPVKRGKR